MKSSRQLSNLGNRVKLYCRSSNHLRLERILFSHPLFLEHDMSYTEIQLIFITQVFECNQILSAAKKITQVNAKVCAKVALAQNIQKLIMRSKKA